MAGLRDKLSSKIAKKLDKKLKDATRVVTLRKPKRNTTLEEKRAGVLYDEYITRGVPSDPMVIAGGENTLNGQYGSINSYGKSMLILAKELLDKNKVEVTPETDDILLFDDEEWIIGNVKTDPTQATWSMGLTASKPS